MVILQDRILLLFDGEWSSWTSADIARALVCPHDEVVDELGRMAHTRLVYCEEHDGSTVVTLNPEGEVARCLSRSGAREKPKKGIA